MIPKREVRRFRRPPRVEDDTGPIHRRSELFTMEFIGSFHWRWTPQVLGIIQREEQRVENATSRRRHIR